MDEAWAGRALTDVLDMLRAAGLPLIWSNQLVSDDSLIVTEPPRGEPRERLQHALGAQGLALEEVGGHWLVVRGSTPGGALVESGLLIVVLHRPAREPTDADLRIEVDPPLPAPERLTEGVFQYTGLAERTYAVSVSAPGYVTLVNSVRVSAGRIGLVSVTLEPEPAVLEELSVSASRYVLQANSQFFIDQRAIQALPDLGEDPVRSVHRLPGAAAGGLSARVHFRGGLENETAIYLNGLKLIDPFHIRDYNNIFSTIDARAISGVEAYTGGFPVNYGDQMSGVLLLQSQRPDHARHYEIGASVYNTSLLYSAMADSGRYEWLATARRSNLDLFLSDDLGKPDYFDIFTELATHLEGGGRLSLNALYADDQVEVITESDPAELEESISDTRSAHVWLRVEWPLSAAFDSETVLSYSRLRNQRSAEVNDPEQMVARLDDARSARSLGFDQHWRWAAATEHRLRGGLEYRHERADYDYRAVAEYFEFYSAWPDIGNPRVSSIQARPSGDRYGLYLADHWLLTANSALDVGLRWDKQTYTDPRFSGQLSPRISFLHDLGETTEFRLTWGRYHQSQAIQRLQVEDGIETFHAPERASHWILGLRHRTAGGYRIRAEGFLKHYERLAPRFENLFDALALIPELEPDRVRVEPESARAAGVELSVEYRGDDDLDWWVSYTLARVFDDLDESDQPRSWDQRHALQAGIAWERGPWEIGAALNWHTGWPTTGMTLGSEMDEEDEAAYYPIPGERNAQQLGDYYSVDFRISRTFDVSRGSLSAFFEVSNASNRENPCCVDFDLDEDEDGNVYLDRTVDEWLPVIPAIGLLWEF